MFFMVVEILAAINQSLATGINDHEDWRLKLIQIHITDSVNLIRFV